MFTDSQKTVVDPCSDHFNTINDNASNGKYRCPPFRSLRVYCGYYVFKFSVDVLVL